MKSSYEVGSVSYIENDSRNNIGKGWNKQGVFAF